MSTGITFGSIGDIIAVGQITLSLAKALSDSRGSVREYQALVKDLERFDQAILQIVALWQNYEAIPELVELSTVAKGITDSWKQELLDFRLKFEKNYGPSLGVGRSSAWLKIQSKKIIWLTEKDDIRTLQSKLQGASSTITLLVLAAMGKSNRLAEATVEFRVNAVLCFLQESVKRAAEEQLSLMKIIDQKLNTEGKKTDLILGTARSGIVSLSQIRSIVIDMKILLTQLYSQDPLVPTIPKGLDTTYKQAPVMFEDALGKMIPIPLDLIISWDMFYVVLAEYFKSRRGFKKVLQGEFAIEDDLTHKELSRALPWTMTFRLGQKVGMNMSFNKSSWGSSCPRCGTRCEEEAFDWIICPNLDYKMRFRNVSYTKSTSFKASEKSLKAIEALSDVANGITSAAALEVPEMVDEPADFQRVQLLPAESTWDSIPAYRLTLSVVEKVLISLFGYYEFYI